MMPEATASASTGTPDLLLNPYQFTFANSFQPVGGNETGAHQYRNTGHNLSFMSLMVMLLEGGRDMGGSKGALGSKKKDLGSIFLLRIFLVD